MKHLLVGLFLTLSGSVGLAQLNFSITIGEGRTERQIDRQLQSRDLRTDSRDLRERRHRRSGIDAVCSRFEHRNSNRSCFMEFDGDMRNYCEVCTEKKSCFMAFNGDTRNFCEAYKENKSCFMAFNGEDRGWCEVLKEGKSCFMSLNGEAREMCERGRIPRQHRFWLE